MAHPYRRHLQSPERPPEEPRHDAAEPALLALVWVSSALRFALAVDHREPFGFQPALALAIAALVPLAVARRGRARIR